VVLIDPPPSKGYKGYKGYEGYKGYKGYMLGAALGSSGTDVWNWKNKNKNMKEMREGVMTSTALVLESESSLALLYSLRLAYVKAATLRGGGVMV